MGEMKESVDSVMQMMGELSKHQPETMRHFKSFMGLGHFSSFVGCNGPWPFKISKVAVCFKGF